MVSFYGDYDTTETVVIPFNTFSSDDPSASITITNLAAADVEIHKDGGTTQRASDNGVTVTIDFDGITGNHIVSIDLSDNSDAGFYVAGSRYQVRMEGTTIHAATVNAWIGAFSIGCTLRPTTLGRTLDVTATGEAGLDLDNTSGTIAAAQLAADCITNAKIADDAIAVENIKNDAITAAKIANAAIDNATFAADVGSTAYATNIIALAVRKVLDVLGMDHLVAVADNDDPVDDSILAKLAATGGDWSTFDKGTDSLQAIRDRGDSAWDTATGFSTHDAAAVVTALGTGSTLTTCATATGFNTTVPDAAGTAAGLHSTTDALIGAIGGDATAANQTTIIGHLTAAKGGTFDGTTDSLEAIRNRGDSAWITGGTGGGSVEWVVTVDDGSNPIEGVQVWVTTDEAGSNTIAVGTSDTLGQVTFMLDAGTYYCWKQLAGFSFTNPETMTVA